MKLIQGDTHITEAEIGDMCIPVWKSVSKYEYEEFFREYVAVELTAFVAKFRVRFKLNQRSTITT